MRYVLALLLGLITGGLLVFYWLGGATEPKPLPGTIVAAPERGGDAPGTAVVTLDEEFFNALLGKIFRDLGAPSFPLRLAARERNSLEDDARLRLIRTQGGCPNEIVLLAEGSGAQTGVRFTEGKILAPLAFKGSYSLLGNCLNFRGWAQTNLQLSFDQEQQTLYGRINVEGVNIEGVAPVVSGLVTLLVRQAINERVNPLRILGASQLALSVPVEASGGALQARAKDVRAEAGDDALRLHITYDFSAAREPQPEPPES